ncbi:TPA: hypothetical protein LS257_001875 [Serratia liquefaciens]|nr:hypothetical protein [Serratia liquefaciens]
MDNKLSELSKPVRIHHDWNRASMSHCGRCDQWEMTIADGDGTQTCASCYDAEVLSEWQNYAEATEQRATALLAELEAKKAKIVELSGLLAHNIERSELAEKLLEDRLEKWQELASNQCIKINELQDKLAAPVRLPELCGDGENDNEYTEGLNDGINQSAKAVRAAGFTVEGDE